MNKIRLLNFDDMYLLHELLDGKTITTAAKNLGLTQPAATQRLRKMEQVFGFALVAKTGRNIKLTIEGKLLCQKARDVLSLMGEMSSEPASKTVRVGTRPEAGTSWLWPALQKIRKSNPKTTYHLYYGSGEEILAQLAQGMLDCVLTSAPVTIRDYNYLDLAREDYVFVARSAIAKKIETFKDLESYTLIEHDRSFPFLRYVKPKYKAKLKFSDVWFVGSSSCMCDAIVKGFGVGIIPKYLAQPFLKSSKLSPIDLNLELEHDFFRLIYRNDKNIEEEVINLADTMGNEIK